MEGTQAQASTLTSPWTRPLQDLRTLTPAKHTESHRCSPLVH